MLIWEESTAIWRGVTSFLGLCGSFGTLIGVGGSNNVGLQQFTSADVLFRSLDNFFSGFFCTFSTSGPSAGAFQCLVWQAAETLLFYSRWLVEKLINPRYGLLFFVLPLLKPKMWTGTRFRNGKTTPLTLASSVDDTHHSFREALKQFRIAKCFVRHSIQSLCVHCYTKALQKSLMHSDTESLVLFASAIWK